MLEEDMFEYEKLIYDWDPNKNEANIKKHGVSFEEARAVFGDTNALFYRDVEHSFEEERFFVIGYIKKLKHLTVFYCERESEKIIRIISARKANKKEKNLYGGNLEWE